MVLIPGGPFTMGRDNGPETEKPGHRVYLPAFYIDKNLVTVADFAMFVQEKGPNGPKGEMYLDVADSDNRIHPWNGVWHPAKGSEHHPAGEVSWHGAVAYCRWKKKRLPSEAEWEKAARGTDGRLYPWGNESPRPDLAFFGGYRGETVSVGQYPKGASPYGVWTWRAKSGNGRPPSSRPIPMSPRTEGRTSPPGGPGSYGEEARPASERV